MAADFGVTARRRDELTGVWTDSGKLAAVGVRVSSGWITSHGTALNVSADLGHFDVVVPCGLAGESVTSLEREVEASVDLEDVSASFSERFADVFECDILVA